MLCFETFTRNLQSNAKLNGIAVVGNRVWSMDTENRGLMTVEDTLADPIKLVSPEDQSAGVAMQNLRIDWETMTGATMYEWQLDTDSALSSLPDGFTDTTSASSARLPVLDPGTTYYWRIRATSPLLSPWSNTMSFTTVLSGAIDCPKLNAPEFGATVNTRPIFQWDPVAGAAEYELLIDINSNLMDPVVNKSQANALTTTAWQCETELEQGTVYYWKVRATNSRSVSEWSNIGVFTTAATTSTTQTQDIEPLVKFSAVETSTTTTVTITKEPAMAPVTTQVFQMQQSAPDWLKPFLYFAVAFIGLLLIMVVLLMVVIFKSQRDRW